MDLRFIVCMIYSFVTMNIPFVLLYIFLGGVLLFSAYSLWEKDKNNRRYCRMDSKALLSLNHLSVWYTADHPLLSDLHWI